MRGEGLPGMMMRLNYNAVAPHEVTMTRIIATFAVVAAFSVSAFAVTTDAFAAPYRKHAKKNWSKQKYVYTYRGRKARVMGYNRSAGGYAYYNDGENTGDPFFYYNGGTNRLPEVEDKTLYDRAWGGRSPSIGLETGSAF